MEINREDMLELTRRMTIARNCFGRIAGGYMDEEGYVDGTFNTHFQKLSGADKTKNLRLASSLGVRTTSSPSQKHMITLPICLAQSTTSDTTALAVGSLPAPLP